MLDSSKLKEFADDNFTFGELSKKVENTVGKGEIACNKQFLLFPLCFEKACFPGASKGVIVWEWVKALIFKIWYVLRLCTKYQKLSLYNEINSYDMGSWILHRNKEENL